MRRVSQFERRAQMALRATNRVVPRRAAQRNEPPATRATGAAAAAATMYRLVMTPIVGVGESRGSSSKPRKQRQQQQQVINERESQSISRAPVLN